jgi:antirestriction protein ArdC
MNKQDEIRSQITNKIVESLESNTVPWNKPWFSKGFQNVVTKKSYRGINTLLLGLHKQEFNLESNVYATYTQWKDLGCNVKKRPESVSSGSWGCNIVYFNILKSKKEVDGEEVEVKFPIMKTYCVFNASQVDGAEELVSKRFENKRIDNIDVADNVFNKYIDKHKIKFQNNTKEAYYSLKEDKICIPNINDFIDSNSYYATLFHEAVHSTGADKPERLNRLNKLCRFGDESYAMEELVAELGTCFVLQSLGLPIIDKLENHVSYISSWLKVLKRDNKAIFQASSEANKACDLIVGKQEEETEAI